MRIETKFFKSKVARRIFVLFVLFALVPVAAGAGLSFTQVTNQHSEQSRTRLYKSCKAVGMEIYERLLFLETEMKMITSLYISGSGSFTNLSSEIFGNRLEQRFYGVSLINDDERHIPIFGRTGSFPILTDSEREHIGSGKTLLTTQHVSGSPSQVLMLMALNPKQPKGSILLAEIRDNYLWGVDEDGANTFPPMTELVVLDQSNRPLFSSIQDLSGSFEQSLKGQPLGRSGSFVWKNEDSEYVAMYRSVHLKPAFYTPTWTVILNESQDNVFAAMTYFKRTFPYVVLITFGVALLASLIEIRRSLVPIDILQKGTLKIANGDFDSELEIKSGDEFEMLGECFNDMSKKIKEGQALLVQSAKMSTMGQMAAGIVHEINQPITAIYAHIQLAVMDEQPGERKETLETIQRAVERLIEIVSKFRTFSRRSDEKMVELSINSIIEEAYELLEHQIRKQRVRCVLEKAEDLSSIVGDNTSLQQVFINLMTNAMDALEHKKYEDSLLTIRTYSNDRNVCVDIEDNGQGIPEEVQTRMFDPFFTTKVAEKGTGLGLAITQSILHKHGARLKVESEEGSGTCFTISFPLPSDE